MAKKQNKPHASKPASTSMRAKDYRRYASSTIKGRSGDFAVIYLVYELILLASMMFFYIISIFVGGAFDMGRIYIASRANKNTDKPKVGDLFYGFKERYGQSLGVYVMTLIFTLLWTLLLIIPGIIKSYAYAMSMFIAHDNPNMSTLDCITESRKMMKGHKWQLFCLRISYIGWMLLVILTLGILSFWVEPKMTQAQYKFYLHIKG